MHDYLTSVDLGTLIGVSDQSIRNWVRRGLAPAHTQTILGHLRFHRKDVLAWLSEQGVDAITLLKKQAHDVLGKNH